MKVIGLTGGIGVGKSTVAALLGEHGAEVIDVDALGRAVIGVDGIAVDAVVEWFGAEVRAEDGSIDRPVLAGIVFGEPEALDALNAISHPAINQLLDEKLCTLAVEAPDSVVILDMAVLTESNLGRGITHPYEQVIVVEAPTDVRINRLIERGHSADDAAARMASQTTDKERRRIADFVITNDADLASLEDAVADLWRQLTE